MINDAPSSHVNVLCILIYVYPKGKKKGGVIATLTASSTDASNASSPGGMEHVEKEQAEIIMEVLTLLA
jgi:hypothetical protein